MAIGKKTGGRKKGTPNKNNPIKTYLRDHSAAYFEPSLRVDRKLADSLTPDDADTPLTPERLAARLGVKVGDMVSRYDIDCATLSAADRVDAEIKLLNFHTPKMQNATIDMTINDDQSRSLEERLAALADDNDQ